jgi:hypothetical protein
VIVARNEVVPVDFASPLLFAPKGKPTEPPVADDNPDKHAESASPVQVAQAATMRSDTAATANAGVSVKSAGAAPPETTTTAPLATPAPETAATVLAPAVGASAPEVGASAPEAGAPAAADPPKPAPDAVDPDKPLPTPPKAAGQPVKHTGTVAVFISRKEKKLFVREGFVPLFDVPVEIEHPEQPLGTHVFTALGLTDDRAAMRWNVMSMTAEPPRPRIAAKIGPKAHLEARPAEPFQPQTPAQALERIQIPQEAVDRIDEILSPGASLVISDQGLGPETGAGTDFIVLTR